ncbi:hypothetical protein D9613_003681 [Agrocybe pediades]|uniref:F-box domain-containing protein n=1 Tax=Agrocybe pediades TaxID=84607 RepID=A0A8H4QJ13_9AGAR|nr:hypothetical protein D9613_003681 [Agrocybe pediades]
MGSLKETYRAFKRRFLAECDKHHPTKFLRPTTRDVPDLPTPNYKFQTLPPELVLHIFAFLELKPYILSHAVCKSWNALLPSTKIYPIRRRLFNLSKQMLSCPNFLKTRPWLLNNLQPFDRQAYIDGLLSQHPHIPEDFRIWILEWPARMAICCMWPGLPLVHSTTMKYDQPNAVIWLPHKSECPELLALAFKQRTPEARFIPALLLWRDHNITMWLIFEKDDAHPELFGSVLILHDQRMRETSSEFPARWNVSAEVRWTYDGREEHYDNNEYPHINTLIPNWVGFQEHLWARLLRDVVMSPRFQLSKYPMEDMKIESPVFMQFRSAMPQELPSPPWTSHLEENNQAYLLKTLTT